MTLTANSRNWFMVGREGRVCQAGPTANTGSRPRGEASPSKLQHF